MVQAGFVVPERPTASPGRDLTQHLESYKVGGATADVVLASIAVRSPVRNDDGSKASDAFAAWSMRWFPDLQSDGAECSVADVRVTLDVTITTWAWRPSPAVPPNERRRIERMGETLLAHEREHETISVLGALDVIDALRGMRGRDCDQVRTAANATGQQVLDRIREVNAALDVATQHGPVAAPGLRRGD